MSAKFLKLSFLNRFLFTISIRSRLLMYFICLILIPTSIISFTLYYKSTDIITNKINSSVEEKLNIIDSNILQKFESINDISSEIYLNKDLIKILSYERSYETTDLISEMSVLNRLLENYSISSISQTLLIPKIYIFNRPEYLMYGFSDKIFDFTVIEKTDWYLNLPPKAKYSVVGLDTATLASTTISTVKFIKKLYGLDDMSISFGGVLTIDVGVDYFKNILSKSNPTIQSSTFVLDSNGLVVVSPDATLMGTNLKDETYFNAIFQGDQSAYGSFIEKIKNDKFLISYKKMDSINWTIVSLTPLAELNKELRSFNAVIYTVMISCLVLALFMALLLSDNISYPIRKLVKSMSTVQNGNFDIKLEYKRNDEFAYLFSTYKKMVNDIKELINKLYVSEVRKKEAELKSLQAQINPHFLYNTLDSINWMALELRADNISTMVTSLSDFFRYSLSKGKDVITLSDEFRQVESYLKIQQTRFLERLEYSISSSNEVLSYLTVKLILQPIVENSIIHGINKISEKGMISITAKKADNIIEIKISDNGAGADVEELNSILDGSSSTVSFGIRNVNDRIRHYFGDEYGIKFYNNDGPGITVILRFPAVKTMEAKNAEDDIG